MIERVYLYFFFLLLAFLSLLFLFFNFRGNKNNINNKLVLKNLLENLDLELPEELKNLDNSATETKKFS